MKEIKLEFANQKRFIDQAKRRANRSQVYQSTDHPEITPSNTN